MTGNFVPFNPKGLSQYFSWQREQSQPQLLKQRTTLEQTQFVKRNKLKN